MNVVIALFTVCFSLFAVPTFASDTQPIFDNTSSAGTSHWNSYVKAGWFNWEEKDQGETFVSEWGPIFAAGLERSEPVLDLFSIAGIGELWGGVMSFQGHDINDYSRDRNGVTAYIGTREEATLGVPIPIRHNGYEIVTIEPFAGFGHKFWIRASSLELWNMVYAPIGVKISHTRPDSDTSFYVKGGEIIPLYTRNDVLASLAGGMNLTHNPKARPGIFGEMGAKFSSWNIAASYEMMIFDRSESTVKKDFVDTPSGPLISAITEYYQPTSKTSTIWLKVFYNF